MNQPLKNLLNGSFLLGLVFLPNLASALGSRKVTCTQQPLITHEMGQEFLAETLELKVVRELFKKGYTKTPVIRRVSLLGDLKLHESFTEEQLFESELIMIQSQGVFDGPCKILIRRARLRKSILQGEQEVVAKFEVEECARGIAYQLAPSLEKMLRVCEQPKMIQKSK